MKVRECSLPSRDGSFVLARSHRFLHSKNTLDPWRIEFLPCSAGPLQLDSAPLGGARQAKMDALVGTRSVTAPAEHVCTLPNSARRKKDLCSNRIPWTPRSANQPQG